MVPKLSMEDAIIFQKAVTLTTLPVEIILSIIEYLPVHSRWVMCHVCSWTRAMSFAYPELFCTSLPLSQEQQLEYSVCLCRDIPEAWVCFRCLKMHDYDAYHIEQERGHLFRPIFRSYPSGFGKPRFFFPSYTRVQLGLKYHRLGCRSQEEMDHYKAIMRPYSSTRSRGTIFMSDVWEDILSVNKIVDGRFLVKATCILHDPQHQILPDLRACSYFSTVLCYHQGGDLVVPSGKRNEGPVEQALHKFIRMGRHAPVEIRAHCPHCPTDYSIRRNIMGDIVVYAWFDLGPEGSPADRHWLVHRMPLRGLRFFSTLLSEGRVCGETIEWPVTVSHEPGSVRALYQRNEMDEVDFYTLWELEDAELKEMTGAGYKYLYEYTKGAEDAELDVMDACYEYTSHKPTLKALL